MEGKRRNGRKEKEWKERKEREGMRKNGRNGRNEKEKEGMRKAIKRNGLEELDEKKGGMGRDGRKREARARAQETKRTAPRNTPNHRTSMWETQRRERKKTGEPLEPSLTEASEETSEGESTRHTRRWRTKGSSAAQPRKQQRLAGTRSFARRHERNEYDFPVGLTPPTSDIFILLLASCVRFLGVFNVKLPGS